MQQKGGWALRPSQRLYKHWCHVLRCTPSVQPELWHICNWLLMVNYQPSEAVSTWLQKSPTICPQTLTWLHVLPSVLSLAPAPLPLLPGFTGETDDSRAIGFCSCQSNACGKGAGAWLIGALCVFGCTQPSSEPNRNVHAWETWFSTRGTLKMEECTAPAGTAKQGGKLPFCEISLHIADRYKLFFI